MSEITDTFYRMVIDFGIGQGVDSREIGPYCTGYTDEYAYEAAADQYRKAHPDDDVFPEYEGYGVLTLQTVETEDWREFYTFFPNPRYFNDGMGTIYPVVGHPSEEEMLATHLANSPDYFKDQSEAMTEVGRYPAYTSVAINFAEAPTKAQEQRIYERAQEYAEKHGLKIEGFRLLKEITTREEVWSVSFGS